MWENIYFQVLVVASLFFFSLSSIVSIIAGLAVIGSAKTVKVKVSELTEKGKETLDQVQDVAYNAGEMGFNVLSILAPFFMFKSRKNKKSGFFSRFFDKE